MLKSIPLRDWEDRCWSGSETTGMSIEGEEGGSSLQIPLDLDQKEDEQMIQKVKLKVQQQTKYPNRSQSRTESPDSSRQYMTLACRVKGR